MKKMGRPKGANNMECVCTIRLDESTSKRLEAYCQLMRKQKSVVIREAINMLIESKNK